MQYDLAVHPVEDAFLIDGTNLLYSAGDERPRLSIVVALARALNDRQYAFHCMFDANTRFLLRESGLGEEPLFEKLVLDAVHYSVVTGGIRADDPLLTLCKHSGHRIITRDQYRKEREERHQWLADEELWLIKPHLAGDKLIIDKLDIVVDVHEDISMSFSDLSAHDESIDRGRAASSRHDDAGIRKSFELEGSIRMTGDLSQGEDVIVADWPLLLQIEESVDNTRMEGMAMTTSTRNNPLPLRLLILLAFGIAACLIFVRFGFMYGMGIVLALLAPTGCVVANYLTRKDDRDEIPLVFGVVCLAVGSLVLYVSSALGFPR